MATTYLTASAPPAGQTEAPRADVGDAPGLGSLGPHGDDMGWQLPLSSSLKISLDDIA